MASQTRSLHPAPGAHELFDVATALLRSGRRRRPESGAGVVAVFADLYGNLWDLIQLSSGASPDTESPRDPAFSREVVRQGSGTRRDGIEAGRLEIGEAAYVSWAGKRLKRDVERGPALVLSWPSAPESMVSELD